jgi:hypothetical protein
MATIHQLQPANPTDQIFFEKRQLRKGMSLRYYGRRSAGQLWFVDRIATVGEGKTTDSPTTLRDWVRLRSAVGGEIRWLLFGYLSYSAIWRLED